MSLAPQSRSAPLNAGRRAAALTGSVLALVLAGCGQTGFEAQTNASYDPGVGSNEAFGQIPVLAALVVDNGGSSGTLSATLTRRIEDEVALTGVTASSLADEDTEAAPLDVSFGSQLDIPSNAESDPLVLTEEEPITISGEGVEAGSFISVTFEFSNGQTVGLNAPVVGRPQEGGLYEDVPGAPDATATPTEE